MNFEDKVQSINKLGATLQARAYTLEQQDFGEMNPEEAYHIFYESWVEIKVEMMKCLRCIEEGYSSTDINQDVQDRLRGQGTAITNTFRS